MCIGYPGRVTAVDETGAIVATEGRLRRASTLIVPDIREGDWVTVAAGTIVERLDPEEAAWIRARLRAAEGAGSPATSHEEADRPTATAPRSP
jgi:hydrogenase assembly chaperone HypC/HupF